MARSVAETSQHHKVKIGAVLVYKNEILSVGCNLIKSHPKQMVYNKNREFEFDLCPHNIHAEFNAVLKYKGIIPKHSIMYVYRLTKQGNQGMGRPCKACQKMLKEYGIYDVVYTTEESIIYEQFN